MQKLNNKTCLQPPMIRVHCFPGRNIFPAHFPDSHSLKNMDVITHWSCKIAPGCVCVAWDGLATCPGCTVFSAFALCTLHSPIVDKLQQTPACHTTNSTKGTKQVWWWMDTMHAHCYQQLFKVHVFHYLPRANVKATGGEMYLLWTQLCEEQKIQILKM